MSKIKRIKRSLGLIDATSLVAGSMIGSGIFIVTAAMARDICCLALIIWLVTG
jgi:APA family basic amino acid/polyamine antiporter